jgi:hypothetical protein
MIYFPKYQHNPAPTPATTMESLSVGLERSCGRSEEVSGKKNLLEKIDLIKREGSSFSTGKQPLNQTSKTPQKAPRKFTAFVTVFLLVLFTFLQGKIFAQTTYTWNGVTSTAWATTTNWTPNGNPGSAVGDIVIIAAAVNQPVLSVAPTNALATLTVNNGCSLSIGTITLSIGNWTNDGAITATTGRMNATTGTCINNGTMTMGTGRIIITTGTFTNNGTVTMGTGRITVSAGGSVTNSSTGTITVTGGANITIGSGNFTNNNTSASVNFGSSAIPIPGTIVAQTIGGFVTTGLVTISKTSGTVTFTGNVNSAGISCTGSGGTWWKQYS